MRHARNPTNNNNTWRLQSLLERRLRNADRRARVRDCDQTTGACGPSAWQPLPVRHFPPPLPACSGLGKGAGWAHRPEAGCPHRHRQLSKNTTHATHSLFYSLIEVRAGVVAVCAFRQQRLCFL